MQRGRLGDRELYMILFWKHTMSASGKCALAVACRRKRMVFCVAVVLLIGMTAKGEEVTEVSDSLAISKALGEVTVSAPQQRRLGGKTVYIPSVDLVKAVNSGVQLLAGMQIPELVVDISTGTMSLMGGGRLSIRIDGRPASAMDVASLSPDKIAKVEYISDPGVRYGDYDGVIDISLRRSGAANGYAVFTNLLQSVNRGWGDYTASLKYDTGRSHWGIDYHSNPMWNMDCYRDNAESITMSDGQYISRTETGIPMSNRMVTHRASLSYSYGAGRDMLLNLQARLFRTDDKYVTAGDIVTRTGGVSEYSYECEVNPVKSWQWDVDIYFHKRLNSKHTIYVNIIPTWTDSHSSHIYDADDLHIDNHIDSKGTRLLSEALWEGRIGTGMLSAGMRSNVSWHTSDDVVQKTRERYAVYTPFVQWKHNAERWQYYIGAEMVHYHVSAPMSKTYTSVNPKAFVRYASEKCGGISLYLETMSAYPALDELIPTLQRIDRYQWYCGNVGLEPYQRYTAKFKYDHKIHRADVGLTVSNIRAVNPVMTHKMYVEDMILGMPVNHGYNNHFEIKGNLRLPLFSGMLTLTAEGGWHAITSRGTDYRHTYSQPFVNAQIMLMHRGWWCIVKYNSVYNTLWGERISSLNNNLMNIGVGYTYRYATFMTGIVNPMGNVAISSHDLSDIAGYDRTYQASGSRQLVWVGVTLNFRHGKSKGTVRKKLDNSQQYESIKNATK